MKAWKLWTALALTASAASAYAVMACTVINSETVIPTYPTLLPLSTAAQICRWVEQCPEVGPSIVDSLLLPLPPPAISNFAACLDILAGPFSSAVNTKGTRVRTLQCVAAATSCTGALTCLPIEDLAAGDSRCSGQVIDPDAGYVQFCEPSGAEAVTCTGDPSEGIGQLALHCSSLEYGSNMTCVDGICGQKQTCTPGSSSCSGDFLSFCSENGVAVGQQDCATQGMTCVVDANGQAGCAVSKTNNAESFTPGVSCDNDAVLLSAQTYLLSYPCSAIGTSCSEDPTARCVVPSPSCKPYDDDMNVCNGTQISVCLAGQPTTFDCATIQTSCSGDSQGKHASCQ